MGIIISFITGVLTGFLVCLIHKFQYIYQLEKHKDKFMLYFNICDHWMELREKKKNVGSALQKKGIHSVAIQGMGRLGLHLLQELKESGINVKYVIDRKKEIMGLTLPVYTLDNELPQIDAVIVTAPSEYDEIAEQIKSRLDVQVVSIETLISDWAEE